MSTRWDAVVIGAGHNGLVAAAYLAKGGLRTLLLERHAHAGGCAATDELISGFSLPVLSHEAGPLLPDVMRDLDLARHGLRQDNGAIGVASVDREGRVLEISADSELTRRSLSVFSSRDAERFPAFIEMMARGGALLAPLMRTAPPDIDRFQPGDVWTLTQAGRQLRKMSRRDAATALRWLSMPIADVVADWFQHERLRALVAARALHGQFAGPHSPMSAAALLMRSAIDPSRAGPGAVQGGIRSVIDALSAAARAAGATIRFGVDAVQISIRDGKTTGVVLARGEEVEAGVVVSTLDPKRTLLGLVDSLVLGPDFAHRVASIRMRGLVAKVNLALEALPTLVGRRDAPPQRFLIAPDLDYLERAFDAAKYGSCSPEPWLDVAIPSLSDVTLAPEGRHVMSVYVQCAPYQLRDADWSSERPTLAARTLGVLEEHLPGIKARVVGQQVLAPPDLEATWGLTGGHVFQGEHTLDQFHVSRPLLGWARYRTPIPGLYLGGAGTHPGGGVTGACGRAAARAVLQDVRRRRTSGRG
jgi:phytoene dehydrogenase-like protein